MTDVFEMDFNEVEMRVLANMRKDAENMDETGSFRRPSDLSGFDTSKVRTLLSLQDAEGILKGEGVVKCPDIHKNRAAEMFDVAPESVTDEQRAFAKSYNYQEMYNHGGTFIEKMVDIALSNARARLNAS